MSQQILMANLTQSSTTPLFALGTTYTATDGTVYQYLQADGAVTANLIYTIAAGYQIADPIDSDGPLPADTKIHACCVSSVTLADNAYMWCFVGPGSFTFTAGEDIDATDLLYAGSTAGAVYDTAGAIILPHLVCETAILSGATGTLKCMQQLCALNPV